MSVPETGPPLVTVIVLNYNGKAYVKRCLNSLFRNSYTNFEVFCIDNNSTDGSAEIAQQLFRTEPRFTLIRNRRNLGFSVGNNIGFKRSNAKYVIILNHDTEVREDFIETMTQAAESDEKIGSVGCKTIQSDGRILYGPKYMSFGFIVHALDKQTYDRFTVNLANCGCASLFRKATLDKMGGFDPYLWTDWEDHDLGYRINSAGFKCVYTPKTTVLHLGGGSYLGMSEQREIRIVRNKLFTYVKNYETANMLTRFPLVLIMEMLLKTKNRQGGLFLKGMIQFFSNIAPIIGERKQIQKHRLTSDTQIFISCRVPEQMSFWKSLKTS